MSETPITAEALLAIRDPRALFPDEPDARRRAYMKLVRQFRPEREPEAFAHLRALYEAVEPPPPRDPTPHRADPSAPSPSDHLVEALHQDRLDLARQILLAHDDEVFAASRGAWSAGWRVVLGASLPAVPPDLAERLAARLAEGAEDANEAEVDRLVDLRRAMHRAATDARIPQVVRDALGVWRPTMSREQASDALEAIGGATRDLDAADALWAQIAREHPALMVILWELGRAARRGAAPLDPAVPLDPPPRFPQAHLVVLGVAWGGFGAGFTSDWPWWTWGFVLLAVAVAARWVLALGGDPYDASRMPRRVFWSIVGVVALLPCAGLALVGVPAGGLAVGMLIWTARSYGVPAWIEERVLRGWVRARGRAARARLEAALRAAGAWPDEIGALLTDRGADWSTRHPVPEVAADPGALARVMGPAHRARWSGP